MKPIQRIKTLLVAGVLAVAASQMAQATLFFTDHFDYPDGSNLGATTGPWNTVTAGTGDSSTQLKVTTASAQTSPSGFAAAANNGVVVAPAASNKKNAAFFNGATGVPATVGNVVYASFLLNVQSLPTAGNIMRTVYMHNGTSSSGTMEVIVSSTGQVGIRKKGNATSLVYAGGTPVSTPGTHLIVMRYTFINGTSNDELALWVDPSNYGDPSAPEGSKTTATTSAISDMSNPFTHIVIDSPNLAAGPVFWVDEVRVGDTWADVTPSSGGCTTAAINADPTNVSVTAGQTANFTITAAGTSPTYQWQFSTDSGANWNPVSSGTGGTTASYTTAATTTGENNYQYRCVVSVACDASTATSSAATLTVSCDTAGISLQPSDLSVSAGQTANFTVTATGSSPTYQWEFSIDNGANWNPVSSGTGGTTASYTTAATTTGENGFQYRCVVSVACDSSTATSSAATLTVSCDTAGISLQPSDISVNAGQTANFTVTATGSSRTYQWEYSIDSGANWNPVITGTGGTTASYTTAATTTGENGFQYRCVVSVACDASTATSSAATLTVTCTTAGISSSPTNKVVTVGQTASFSVVATGSSRTYQWQYSTDNGANWNPVVTGTGGTTASYTTAATVAGDNNSQYRCVVSVACDSSTATSSAATLSVLDPSAISYRSAASGSWQDLATWEYSTDNGSSWSPALFTPTSANCTNITIKAGTTVSLAADVTADQMVVAAGGSVSIASNTKLSLADGADTDLTVFGTVENISSSGSALTLAASATMVVGSGGVVLENGTSSGWITPGAGSTITFAAGGKFQLVKTGGRIPLAIWNAGSICEIAYTTDGSRPDTAYLSQDFAHFTVNCPLNTSGWDFAGKLTNVLGNFTATLGAPGAGVEFKLFSGSTSSGGLNIGGNLTMNSGRLNVASSGGPWTITLTSNLLIGAGASMDVSGSSSQSYTLILNGSGTQNYTCDGGNTATKLNWTVNSGSTLNLNNDLALSNGGRTLTANGIVNLNGKTLIADLLAGAGTVRNQGGGAGLLVLGAGGGVNTLGSTPSLVNGASGTLGLGKSGSGALTITDPQTFSGGLVVSNGTALVNNTTGSGTGSGAVSVVGGTLGGTGSIAGAVTVESGGNLAPGASIDDLTISGVLTLNGNFTSEVNMGSTPNTDQVLGTSAVNYGGTLTINNLGAALTTADTFQIFPAGTRSGTFTLSPVTPDNNAGLAWDTSTLATDGTLRIVTGVVVSPNLNVSQSGGTLTFSWSEAGFKLQSQTNSLTTGLGNNWSDYPGGGTSPVNVDIDPAEPTVFFRLSQ